VDYKRVNTFFADYAKNISKGGTFIQTDRPLDVGTEFVFLLTIPGREAPIELRGQVMWTVTTASATEEHPAGMGIRFLFERDQERRSLHGLVESLMSDKLGPRVTQKLLGKR
jgi:type IV pilus assembly protein PilZ